MFRNAIGDYQVPYYKYWSENLDLKSDEYVVIPQAMVYIIWIWWICIIIFLPIVQLNFLIAFISEAFEDVLDTSMQIKYTKDAD